MIEIVCGHETPGGWKTSQRAEGGSCLNIGDLLLLVNKVQNLAEYVIEVNWKIEEI